MALHTYSGPKFINIYINILFLNGFKWVYLLKFNCKKKNNNNNNNVSYFEGIKMFCKFNSLTKNYAFF